MLVVVLGAAALHVFWNTLVKASPDTYLGTVIIAAGGGIWCAVALPFLPAIHPLAWWNVAGSVVAQCIYYPLVAAAYRAGDMSLAYPLMRGTAPLLVAVVSGPVIGELLTPGQWCGLALVCAGIWAIGWSARSSGPVPRRAVLLALLNAVVIATYTLIDGIGVRRSGAPATYTAWIFLFTAIPVVTVALIRRRTDLAATIRRRWWVGAVGGLANVGAYGLVLWAMTRAPVAAVAALRETSTLMATVVAALWLHERITGLRIAGTVLVAAGAVTLRLA